MSAPPNPPPADGFVLAVDIGGTKIAAALVSPDGAVHGRRQVPTSQDGPQAGIAQIALLLQHLLSDAALPQTAVLGVGIGIPAVLDLQTDRVIWAPNLPGWRDVPLRERLQELVGLPVFVEYDGHTAVLGEWWAGAGRGYTSLVDIIIGTGIGGGLILDGRLVRGRDRLAGAAGWFALTTNAVAENPDQRQIGHWESLAAGPGIAARAAALLPDYPDSQLARQGTSLDARAVFAAARAGDELAAHIVAQTAAYIGLGVANIVSLVNPEIIILGGSVGAQGDLLLPGIREAAANWAQPISATAVQIVASTLATDAGLFGAAYAAYMRLGQET